MKRIIALTVSVACGEFFPAMSRISRFPPRYVVEALKTGATINTIYPITARNPSTVTC